LVKKVGFIGEGGSDVIILKSRTFEKLLNSYGLNRIDVLDAEGIGNFYNPDSKVKGLVNVLENKGAEKIIILSDLEDFPCIREAKKKLANFTDKQINIITKKALESWFLADNDLLKKLLEVEMSFVNPENPLGMPYDEIKYLLLKFNKPGPGSKTKLAKKVVSADFSIQNAASHHNCNSAKYFLKQLNNLRT
jgi:hypothetical protein